MKALVLDVQRIIGAKKYRLLYFWMSRGFIGVLLYRLERQLYLFLGAKYKVVRILLLPLINLMKSYANIDIHYLADIKGGLLILHPSVGVVVSGKSRIGKNLTLVGGNVIGYKKNTKKESFVIGDNCEMGANATLIGPLELGNNIKIGASACVVNSFKKDHIVLVGVPAKQMN